MKRVFLILAALVLVTGCYKSILTYTTHPDNGKLVATISLPNPDSSAEIGDYIIPDSYTLILNSEEIVAGEEDAAEFSELLEPGEYTVYAYSNTADLEIENSITETGDGTIVASTSVEESTTTSLSEDLYFGKEDFTACADEVTYSVVNLEQITRTIKFNLQIIEGDHDLITSFTASLSGIAQQWECVEDIPTGDAVTINPVFFQGESTDYLTSSIKVLGINGNEQILTIEIEFTNGKTQTIINDLSEEFAGSNDSKSTPLSLSGSLKVNTEFGATGTITDWVVYEGGYDFDANQPNQ